MQTSMPWTVSSTTMPRLRRLHWCVNSVYLGYDGFLRALPLSAVRCLVPSAVWDPAQHIISMLLYTLGMQLCCFINNTEVADLEGDATHFNFDNDYLVVLQS